MGAPILEPNVNRSICHHLAMVGVLVAACLLTACGRKGPLDPPPGGLALQPGSTRTPVTPRGLPASQAPRQEFDEDGRPIAPQGPKQRHPLDWLLD
jgi:predicted small lipoprotein YifL